MQVGSVHFEGRRQGVYVIAAGVPYNVYVIA